MQPLNPTSVPLDGLTLIEASAGTGKTYTITTLFSRLIAERGIPVSDILVVTFTEAAASELDLKIEERLRAALAALKAGDTRDPLLQHLVDRAGRGASKRIRTALEDFDTAAISTIHGFCRRLLADHAFESGVSFDRELVKETRPHYEALAEDYFARETQTEPDLFLSYLEEARVGPGDLADLLEQWSRTGEAPVLPRETLFVDPSPLLEAAFFDGKHLFFEARDDLERLFAEDPGIDRRSYRKDHVRRWLDQAGRYFESDTPVLPLPEYNLHRFTTRAVASKVKAESAPPTHPFFEVCDRLAAAMADLERWLVRFKRRFLEYAENEGPRRKAEENVHTFDDLLRLVDRALEGPAGAALKRAVQARYKALLIDEFQDTDARQYRIFKRLFGDSAAPVFLIGDPKQAIYGFRGGDIFTYLSATEDARDSAYTLEQNWRSDPALIHAVNTLFDNASRPFAMDRIAFRPVSPRPKASDRFPATDALAPFEIRFWARDGGEETLRPVTKTFAETSLPPLVAGDIAAELEREEILGRRTEPSDIAVLVRTNAEARRIQRALHERGILGVLWGETSVFDSLEADELYCVLTAVASPKHPGRLTAALTTRLFGLDARKLGALREVEGELERWTTLFDEWRDMWRRRGFIQMFAALLYSARVEEAPLTRLAAEPLGERAITNFRHLAELLEQRAAEADLSMTALLEWFNRETMAKDRRTTEDAELRLESDGNAVRIITVHKSKGLQFPITYCPFLWSGSGAFSKATPVVFHDSNPPNGLYLDLGGDAIDEHRALAAAEAAAEDMRLLYVALTRAEHRCIIVWGAFNGMSESPLARLLHPSRPATELAKLDDDALTADLKELTGRSFGAIRVGAFDTPKTTGSRSAASAPALTHREGTVILPSRSFTSSFSSMTARGPARSDRLDAGEDEKPGYGMPGPVLTAAPFPDGLPSSPAEDTVILEAFERGPRAGSCLHAVFEALDFASSDLTQRRALVARALDEFGLEASRWTDPVCRAVHDTLNLPLDPGRPDLCLSRVTQDRKLSELEFVFPMALEADRARVSSTALAQVLAVGDDRLPRAYIDQVAAMGFEPLCGFMKGFIDLVFEHDGMFYIVDYKSNYLGPSKAHYGRAEIGAAMASHHYHLQYLIYTVALDRLLAARVAGYDYDRQFGGVYYLFLRGIQEASSSGVFFHRPKKALIQALGACFEGRTPRIDARRSGPAQLSLPGISKGQGAGARKTRRKKR